MIMLNKDILQFVTFCIGRVSQRLNMSPNWVYQKLRDSGILYDYIVPSYDVLHTFSSRYLTDDIVDYMKEKGVIA